MKSNTITNPKDEATQETSKAAKPAPATPKVPVLKFSMNKAISSPAVSEDFTKKPSVKSDENSNSQQEDITSKTLVLPPIVHLVWVGGRLPQKVKDSGDIYEKIVKNWEANKSVEGFRLILWSDRRFHSGLDKFCERGKLHIDRYSGLNKKDNSKMGLEIKHYSELLDNNPSTANILTNKLCRENPGSASDIIRLLALKELGGYYSDVNDEPYAIFNDPHSQTASQGILVGGTEDKISNNLLAAVPDHPVINTALKIIEKKYKENTFFANLNVKAEFNKLKGNAAACEMLRSEVIATTGPGPLAEAVHQHFPDLTEVGKFGWPLLTEKGKADLQLSKQEFFIKNNKGYQTGTGNSWTGDLAMQTRAGVFGPASIAELASSNTQNNNNTLATATDESLAPINSTQTEEETQSQGYSMRPF